MASSDMIAPKTASADAPPTVNDQELLAAVKHGKLNYVLDLLRRGAPLNARHGPDQYTLLHAAAECGRAEAVKLLIEHGADVEARLTDGSSALHLAARQGHAAAVTALLDAHAPINSKDNSGQAPLHVAAAVPHPATMDLLLKAGADVDALDNHDKTPLHLCSCQCNAQAASLLLDAGAHVAAECDEGYTPLHYACRWSQLAVVRVLLGAGAAVDAVTDAGQTPLHLASKHGMDADGRVVDTLIANGALLIIPDSEGYLPLHVAAEANYIIVATRLLRANPGPVHVNAGTDKASTPLHLAAGKGHGKMAALLLAAGADLEARDVNGRTPLQHAVRDKQHPMVKQLLAAGADPGTADNSVVRPLHLAAIAGHTGILQALLAALAARPGGGGGVDAVTVTSLTPLHLAAEHGNVSCVRVLIAAGADVNKVYGAEAMAAGRSLAGATALHRAVQLKRAGVVPLLGTPANMRHLWRGQTPLHLALSCGCVPSMAQALVAAGSPVGVADTTGSTAMTLAAGSGHLLLKRTLPDMVRGECERYKQLQQLVAAGGRQPQQQRDAQQQDPAALLAAVVEGVFTLLRHCASSDSSKSSKNPEVCMDCLQVMLEVLGGAGTSSLVQQVLGKCVADDAAAAAAAAAVRGAAAAGRCCTVQLVKALCKGCSAALEPLMEQRWGLTNRLQQLVAASCEQTPPATQQQRGRGRRGAKSAAAAGDAPKQAVTDDQLAKQAMAAVKAGDWQQFVQLWDQLTGRNEASASRLLSYVEQRLRRNKLAAVGALCEALIDAWAAAEQQVASRMQRELAEAVVGAVRAAGQQQQVVTAGGARRGRGGRCKG